MKEFLFNKVTNKKAGKLLGITPGIKLENSKFTSTFYGICPKGNNADVMLSKVSNAMKFQIQNIHKTPLSDYFKKVRKDILKISIVLLY